MARRFSLPFLVLLVLAFGAAEARAATYDFSVSPNPPNEDETTTFTLLPSSATGVTVQWDLDGAPGFEASGRTATRVYPTPGTVRVRMRVSQSDGHQSTVTKNITVNGAPAVDFGFTPATPLTGQEVAFSPDATDPESDSVTFSWRFGDGATAAGPAPTHAYDAAGTYAVALTATDEHGASTTTTQEVTVAQDPGPTPGFEYSPANPLTDDVVVFSSTSTPSQGSITGVEWDLDGDGTFDDATGNEASRAFASAGDHLVQMRVTQTNGLQSVAFAHIEVAERPAPPPPPLPPNGPGADPGGSSAPITPLAPALRPARMRPFPVVRIAGVVLARGAQIQILSVRAPRGAQVLVRCRGRGCPVGAVARTSATRVVRIRRFERRLAAGVTLELFVRQAGKIGKYTRFLIRAGKPPARIDRCLIPGRPRPVRCG
jgi:PKD repeat protein